MKRLLPLKPGVQLGFLLLQLLPFELELELLLPSLVGSPDSLLVGSLDPESLPELLEPSVASVAPLVLGEDVVLDLVGYLALLAAG